MKKFIAIIAAIALIATMSVAVFAADTTVKCTTEDQTLGAVDNGFHTADSEEVELALTGDITHVICVDVEWGGMEFEYTGKMTWNPHTLQYDVTEAGVYQIKTTSDATIDFVNRSDVPVVITAEYNTADVEGATANGVTLDLSDVEVKMAAVTVDADNNATVVEMEDAIIINSEDYPLGGTPVLTMDDDNVTIGTITLTVEEDDAA